MIGTSQISCEIQIEKTNVIEIGGTFRTFHLNRRKEQTIVNWFKKDESFLEGSMCIILSADC